MTNETLADDYLPEKIQSRLVDITRISKDLRKDRELSFYGSEDITPSQFYEKHHAEKALSDLGEILTLI